MQELGACRCSGYCVCMELLFLTSLTMIAFAANSVLTRAAVDGGFIGPEAFAVLRVLSGVIVLCAITAIRRRALPRPGKSSLVGAASLTAYMIGFTLAYRTLDAGLGALLLFGTVQIAMFLHGLASGAFPSLRQVLGAGIAFAGLAFVLWPGAGARTDAAGAALMVTAGIGWAIYTVSGRRARDPLATTAMNFLLCLPLTALLLVGANFQAAPTGIALAVISGGVTSGLGYALWYSVLPRLEQTVAAVVQLSVPIIAIVAGTLLLGERLAPAVLIAAVFVIGGIALAVTSGSARAGRR